MLSKKLNNIFDLGSINLPGSGLLQVQDETGAPVADLNSGTTKQRIYGSSQIDGSHSVGGSQIVSGAGVIVGPMQANGLNYPSGPGIAGYNLQISSPGNVALVRQKSSFFQRVEGPIEADGDTAWVDALTANFNLPVTADYKYTVSYIWNHNAVNSDFLGRLLIDGVEQFLHKQEPKDAGGGDPSGTTQRYGFTKVDFTNIINGNREFKIQVATDNGNHKSNMYKIFLQIEEL